MNQQHFHLKNDIFHGWPVSDNLQSVVFCCQHRCLIHHADPLKICCRIKSLTEPAIENFIKFLRRGLFLNESSEQRSFLHIFNHQGGTAGCCMGKCGPGFFMSGFTMNDNRIFFFCNLTAAVPYFLYKGTGGIIIFCMYPF